MISWVINRMEQVGLQHSLNSSIIKKYLPSSLALISLALISYYVYFLFSNNLLSIEPFITNSGQELLFMYDMSRYQDRPTDFIKSFITVIHFWLMNSAIILYFTLLTKLFNPFPNDNGYYVFMIDANRLHILRLKETYTKIFVWRKKTYFIPNTAFKFNRATVLLYVSNISVALSALRISKDDLEMMVKVLLNYVYSHEAYVNRVSRAFKIFPRDVLIRNYVININTKENVLSIIPSPTIKKGAYNVTRFITCDIYVTTEENEVAKLTESSLKPSLVIGEIEVPLLTTPSTSKRDTAAAAAMMYGRVARIFSHIDFGMNVTNPYLAYDIMKYRKIINNLHKFFLGILSSKMLPIILIMFIIIILVLFFPQIQTWLSPPTTTPMPAPTPSSPPNPLPTTPP